MAVPREKPRSPFWWACFYLENGSRSQRSTRLLSTQANRKAAQRMTDDLEDAHQKKATEGQMRRILTDLNERLVGSATRLCDVEGLWRAMAGSEKR